jgi:hypothetical protein
LINDITQGNTSSTTVVRIVTYSLDPATLGQTRQYLYLLDDPATLGGAVSEITAIDSTTFLVDERDSAFPGDPGGASKLKKIYKISIAGATDVGVASVAGDTLDPARGLLIGGTATIENYVKNLGTNLALTTLQAHGIQPASKTLAVDLLRDIGDASKLYTHDKVEDLTLINGGRTLVISNDDDFGVVNGATPGSIATKTIPTLPGTPADFTQFLFVDLNNLPSQTATETVTVNVLPAPPLVETITGPPIATASTPSTVTYTVTYTDSNLGTVTLSPADVVLNRTGTANAQVGVSGAGATWTVTLTDFTGVGALGISLPAGTATDLAGNPAPAAGPSATVSVKAGYLSPVTGDRTAFYVGLTPQQRFVQALYLDALGRAGTVDELNLWLGLLDGPNGRNVVALAIENSPEGRTNLVQGWYHTYLGRSAVNGEEQGHVHALLAGASEEVVLSGILGSPEFFARAEALITTGTAQERFVQALYRVLFNRTASASEVAGHVAELNAGASQAQVAQLFLTSPEARTLLTGSYYSLLLHRTASTAEINGWVNSPLNAFQIRVAFESSPEFFTNG